MEPSTLLPPRRSLAFPFVVVLYPLLWVVLSENEISAVGRPITDTYPQVIALTAGAVAVSYTVAAVVAAALIPDSGAVPAWSRTVVAPSNATLAVVCVLSLALGAYIVASSVIEIPRWVDAVAGPAGLLLGWPMVGSVIAVYAVGNTFPTLQIPFAVEYLVVLIGAALTAAWLFAVSGWLAGFVPSTLSVTYGR